MSNWSGGCKGKCKGKSQSWLFDCLLFIVVYCCKLVFGGKKEGVIYFLLQNFLYSLFFFFSPYSISNMLKVRSKKKQKGKY